MGEGDRRGGLDSEKGLKMLHCWLERWRKEPIAKICRLLLEAVKGKKMDYPLKPPENM